jgi:hypothetical protein
VAKKDTLCTSGLKPAYKKAPHESLVAMQAALCALKI